MEGLWIVLLSLVAPFEDKVLTVLSLIVAFGLACYFKLEDHIAENVIAGLSLMELSICQNCPASEFPSKIMRMSFLIKTNHPDLSNSNIMHKGDGFSAKPLGKSLFRCQNVWSDHGPAGQF